MLFAMLFVSGAVGVLFARETAGRDLSETQDDVGQARTRTGRFARTGAGATSDSDAAQRGAVDLTGSGPR